MCLLDGAKAFGAKRDAFWTVAINAAHDDPGHPLVRLTDWSLHAGVA